MPCWPLSLDPSHQKTHFYGSKFSNFMRRSSRAGCAGEGGGPEKIVHQHFDIQTAPIKCFHHFFLASRNNSRQPYRQTTHAQTESSVHFILAVHINCVQTAIGLNIFFIIISLWDMCQANARTGVAKTRHTYPPTARNEGMSSKLIGTTAYARS